MNNQLIIDYKSADKKCKNKIIVLILKEYNNIFKKLISPYCHNKNDYDIGYSLCTMQLLLAIDRYDINSKVLFSTLFFYYTRGFPRLLCDELNYFPVKTPNLSYIYDESLFNDFLLDLTKIFNPEEMISFKAYVNRNVSSYQVPLKLKRKLESYLYDDTQTTKL